MNTTFLNTLSSTWQNKIATHAYKVGGMAWDTSATAKDYYDTEIGSSSSSTTDSMKIGLMYESDYEFAASNNYWTTPIYNYNGGAQNNNWMFTGLSELTITRMSSNSAAIFYLISLGWINGTVTAAGSGAVRPVFYLTSSTQYVSGSGTSSDPIRIN